MADTLFQPIRLNIEHTDEVYLNTLIIRNGMLKLHNAGSVALRASISSPSDPELSPVTEGILISGSTSVKSLYLSNHSQTLSVRSIGANTGSAISTVSPISEWPPEDTTNSDHQANDVSLVLFDTEMMNWARGIYLGSHTRFDLIGLPEDVFGVHPPVYGSGVTIGIATKVDAQDIHGNIVKVLPTIGVVRIPETAAARSWSELTIEPVVDVDRDITISTYQVPESELVGGSKVRVFRTSNYTLARGDICRNTSTGVRRALGVETPVDLEAAVARGLLGACLFAAVIDGELGQWITEGPARVRVEANLTLSIGDTIFLSRTEPGWVTNVFSGIPGEYNIELGHVLDLRGYVPISGAGHEIVAYLRIGPTTQGRNPRYLTLG